MSGKLRLLVIGMCIAVGVVVTDLFEYLVKAKPTPPLAFSSEQGNPTSGNPSAGKSGEARGLSKRVPTTDVKKPATIIRANTEAVLPLSNRTSRLIPPSANLASSDPTELPAESEAATDSAVDSIAASALRLEPIPASAPPGSVGTNESIDPLEGNTNPPPSQSRIPPPSDFGAAFGKGAIVSDHARAKEPFVRAKRLVLTEPTSFWTISEQHYGSGSYFKALYIHNRDRITRADRLGPGDVIEVPTLDELRELYPQYCPISSNQLRTTSPILAAPK